MAQEIERNRRILQALLCLIVAGSAGCSSVEPAPLPIAPIDGPSEFEFNRAMESAGFDSAPVTGEVCRPVRLQRCDPIPGGERIECTYRYQHDRLGTAVLERHARVFWRWDAGPRNCTARRPGDPAEDWP